MTTHPETRSQIDHLLTLYPATLDHPKGPPVPVDWDKVLGSVRDR